MYQRILASLLLCIVTGCGPMMFPMVPRLNAEDQHRVDQMWDNMLSPVNRVDRETLLDCIILFSLQQTGVDEFHAKSIKYTHAGRVEMTIDFNRSKPSSDRFKIRVIRGWRTVRQEQYGYDEIFQHVKDLTGWRPEMGGIYGLGPASQPTTVPTTEATTEPTTESTTEPTTQMSEEEAELQRRLDRIMAATQPATVPQK